MLRDAARERERVVYAWGAEVEGLQESNTEIQTKNFKKRILNIKPSVSNEEIREQPASTTTNITNNQENTKVDFKVKMTPETIGVAKSKGLPSNTTREQELGSHTDWSVLIKENLYNKQTQQCKKFNYQSINRLRDQGNDHHGVGSGVAEQVREGELFKESPVDDLNGKNHHVVRMFHEMTKFAGRIGFLSLYIMLLYYMVYTFPGC